MHLASNTSDHIVISRSFIKVCKGNYNHAAALQLLALHSKHFADESGWFARSQSQIAEDLELSRDQVARSIRFLSEKLPSVLSMTLKKVDGAPTTHYRINFSELKKLTQ